MKKSKNPEKTKNPKKKQKVFFSIFFNVFNKS